MSSWIGYGKDKLRAIFVIDHRFHDRLLFMKNPKPWKKVRFIFF